MATPCSSIKETASYPVSSATAVSATPITASTAAATSAVSAANGPIPLKDRRVAVLVNFTRDGFGDLSAGFKFLDLLNTAAKVPKEKIWLITTADRSNVEMFNFKKWQVILVRSATKLKEEIDRLNIQFLLVAPTMDWRENVQPWSIPKGYIVEYGYKSKSPTISMGVKKEDIGIFIDPALREASLKAEDGPTRLSRLAKVPQKLCDAILGPLKTTHVDRCAAFHANSRFYFGYGKEIHLREKFILTVAQKVFQKCKEKSNLTFYMPGKIITFDERYTNEMFLKAGASAIRHVDFVDLTKNPILKEEILEKTNAAALPSERVITVITGPRLPHEQFVETLLAAEEDVLVMGDQSFSEAVALSKLITYECRHHKEDFFNDLVDIAYRLGHDFGAFFEASKYGSVDFLFKCATSHKEIWKKFIEEICTQHDIKNKFVEYLESCLKDDPLVGSNAKTYAELDPKPFTENLVHLPFDKKVYITLAQMCALKLRYEGNSERPEFADSLFDYQRTMDGYYIVRKKVK